MGAFPLVVLCFSRVGLGILGLTFGIFVVVVVVVELVDVLLVVGD